MTDVKWYYPPKIVPVEGRSVLLDVGQEQPVLGWCSRRFLGGKVTFWAWMDVADGHPRCVVPQRWRYARGGDVTDQATETQERCSA